MIARFSKFGLSPLPGLGCFLESASRLTPWANVWRRSAPDGNSKALNSKARMCRQTLAHGVSRGIGVKNQASPEGATQVCPVHLFQS